MRSGVSGVSRWRTPRCDERVDHRVVDRRDRADRAGLADTLRAERVRERRRLHVHDLERGELGRRDHQVVGEVRRLGLAVVRIAHGFEQRLRDTLRDARRAPGPRRAAGSGSCRRRPPPRAAREPGVAGLGVDLDDREVRAERERRHHRREVALRLQRLALGRRRSSSPVDDLARACPRRGTRRARCRARRRRAAHSSTSAARSRARSTSVPVAASIAAPPICTERDPTVRPPRAHLVGVAVHHLDVVDRHAGALGHHHRPRRVVSLTERRRTAAHADAPSVEQLDRAELAARRACRDLDVHRDPDAERDRIVRGPASRLLCSQRVVVRGGQARARAPRGSRRRRRPCRCRSCTGP